MRMSYLISLENYKLQIRNWLVRPGTYDNEPKKQAVAIESKPFLLLKILKKNQE